MRICLISRGDLSLFPPTQGASVKIYYTLKSLSDLDHRVYFVAHELKEYLEFKRGCCKKKSYPRWLLNLFPYKVSFNKILAFLGIPATDLVLYHPLFNLNLWLKSFWVCKKERVDIIQAEFPAFAMPALFAGFLLGKPVILVEHNIEYFRIKESFELNSRGDFILKLVEKLVCKLCDLIITIIPQDRDRLSKLGIPKQKIKIIPHGVDLEKFKQKDGKAIRKKLELKFPTLIFHGVLIYKPNFDALRSIKRAILPGLHKLGIKPHVLVVGDFPPPGFVDPAIKLTGVVKDLQNFIDAADLAIVPIQAGGGMRMKILEYFAAKKPVISTPKGVEGIPVSNGKEIIITPIENFPKEIKRLIGSERLRARLAENAYKFVQSYDWKEIAKRYVEVYQIAYESG